MWLYQNLFIHFPVDRHLDGFHFGTNVNKAAVLVQIFRVRCFHFSLVNN